MKEGMDGWMDEWMNDDSSLLVFVFGWVSWEKKINNLKNKK